MDFFISSSPLEEAFLNLYQMIPIFGHYNKQSQNIINKKFFLGCWFQTPNVQTLGKVVDLSVKHTETEGRINEKLRRCTMQRSCMLEEPQKSWT